MKILVIPSWYPNKELTSGGSQFREQSEFFLKRFEMRVLFGTKSELPLAKWLIQHGLNHTGPLEQETTQAGLTEYRFDYKPWRQDERHQTGAMIEGYKQALNEIISSGWKPELIHARCADPAGIIASYLAQELSIPWILSEHQVFALGNFSDYKRKLIRKAIQSATKVTVVSQHQLRSIITNYIYRPMVVTGNLVDEEKFQQALPNEKSHAFRILSVMYPGRIKDPETFMRAISEVVNKGHRDIEVTIVGKRLGSENDASEFQRLALEFGIQPYCKLIPAVTRERMPEYYANADVLVSTSLAETFGLAVREAMAVGIPVVCTASGGVDDDIFDFNGFKVNIYDYKAIADAIIAIKTGVVMYDPIRIRNYVISKYGQKAYLDNMSIVFEDALRIGAKGD